MTGVISNASKSNNLTNKFLIAKSRFYVYCHISQIKKRDFSNFTQPSDVHLFPDNSPGDKHSPDRYISAGLYLLFSILQ